MKMEVKPFQILLIDVTLCLYFMFYILRIFYVLIKKLKRTEYNRDRRPRLKCKFQYISDI